MRKQVLGLVDRLAERGLIDRYGFLSFAFGGALLIILAKAIGVGATIVAILAVSAIVAYAMLVQVSGTGRLRGDQAGDNCYYLGLIYTLASLAYAIFTFDPAGTATTIIQGFGVALATTIVGLVLRVYFNQSRPDIAEAETSARLELAQASGKLKAELSRSVVSMNDFSRQTRQSLEELREELVESLKTVKAAAEQAVQEMAERAKSAVNESSDAAVGRAKKLTTATDKVVSGMETQVTALSGLENAQERILASFGALEDAANRSQAILENLVDQSSRVGALQASAAESVQSIAAAASLLNEHVEGLNGSTGRLEGVLADKIAEIQVVPRSVADSAVGGIEEAIGRIHRDLQTVVETQKGVLEALSEQVRGSAEAASRHNGALEAELARSRDNVAKVHTALVDMTGQLANRVEARTV